MNHTECRCASKTASCSGRGGRRLSRGGGWVLAQGKTPEPGWRRSRCPWARSLTLHLGFDHGFCYKLLATVGCSNSPVHPGSESGWSAGRERPGRARWQCGGSCSHQQLLLLLNHVTGRKAPTHHAEYLWGHLWAGPGGSSQGPR